MSRLRSKCHQNEVLEKRTLLSLNPQMLADLNPGGANSSPRRVVEAGGFVDFQAGDGTSLTGNTLDPADGGQRWTVDRGSDQVDRFENARTRTFGSETPTTSFALAAGNTNPQGIADPPGGPTDRGRDPQRPSSKPSPRLNRIETEHRSAMA